MAEMMLVVHRTRSPSLVDSVTVAFDQFRLFLLGKTVGALHAVLCCAVLCCALQGEVHVFLERTMPVIITG